MSWKIPVHQHCEKLSELLLICTDLHIFRLETSNDFLLSHFFRVDFSWKTCHEAVPVCTCPSSCGSVAFLGLHKVPCDPPVALAPCVPSAEGHTCFGCASWSFQTVTTQPPHPPLCSVSSQSSWVCAAVKWVLPSSCSPCAQWSQIGSFKMVPPFGCFFTSLTVSHSWCYYFMAPTDWNILWCFKEPLFHCKVPQFQWLAMYFK